MVSWIIGLIIVSLVAAFMFFLGIGLLILFGGVLIVGVIVFITFYIFGSIEEMIPNRFWLNESNIAQKFMTCLIEERPANCRKSYTDWGEGRQTMMVEIAYQAQTKLGHRNANSISNSQISTTTNNGISKTEMKFTVDYEKHKQVHEQWHIQSNKNGPRITSFKWEY